MELLRQFVDFVLHLDTHLDALVQAAGSWTYAVLGLIVFCETGLVVLPFLPGDSLLFAAGALTARAGAGLNVHVLAVILIACAIVGDAVNYAVGRFFGERIAARFVKPAYLERTRQFYARHGGKTVLLARFVPIVRTLAPFVAGMGAMDYRRFLAYNVVGAVVWVVSLLYAGYFFGNIPVVRDNFTLVVLAIVALSVVPVLVEAVRDWLRRRRETAVNREV